jgi:hypothetical protein
VDGGLDPDEVAGGEAAGVQLVHRQRCPEVVSRGLSLSSNPPSSWAIVYTIAPQWLQILSRLTLSCRHAAWNFVPHTHSQPATVSAPIACPAHPPGLTFVLPQVGHFRPSARSHSFITLSWAVWYR